MLPTRSNQVSIPDWNVRWDRQSLTFTNRIYDHRVRLISVRHLTRCDLPQDDTHTVHITSRGIFAVQLESLWCRISNCPNSSTCRMTAAVSSRFTQTEITHFHLQI